MRHEYRHRTYSTYDLKYHVVFRTKYRYRVPNRAYSTRVVELIREICSINYMDIVSGNISPDHVHMLVSAFPNPSLSKIVQYMEGESSQKLQQEFEILKKKYWG
ncbi:MAG: IS200/IS605 family transposase [Puniceicoccales bacterium]|jgi:putative transposase|nr:IS200/IS605 family transposase [Puniceicoccales bacterium]